MGKMIYNQELIEKNKKDKLKESEMEQLKQQLEDEKVKNAVLEQTVLEVQNYIVDLEYEKLLNQGGMQNDI